MSCFAIPHADECIKAIIEETVHYDLRAVLGTNHVKAHT